MNPAVLLPPLLAWLLAPLLFGVINRTKAFFAGRRGQPLLQAYYDLWKLLHKARSIVEPLPGCFAPGPSSGWRR